MARVLNALALVLVIVLFLLAIALVGVRAFGLTPYAVLSGSMEPVYPVGSLIYVAECDPSEVQPGDAITFHNGSGQVATHQAYEVDTSAQEIRTQGIANINPDGSIMHDAEPVAFSQVIGMPVACVPLLGYLSVALSTPPTSYMVIAGAIALVALSWFASSWARRASRPVGSHMRR